jgi:hypothetical protein
MLMPALSISASLNKRSASAPKPTRSTETIATATMLPRPAMRAVARFLVGVDRNVPAAEGEQRDQGTAREQARVKSAPVNHAKENACAGAEG